MPVDQVTARLAALDPLRRAILETAALPGMTAGAIAEHFGWSLAMVHRELRGGLAELGRGPSAPG